jgi:regulator of extracellular matrix RemA (YlzA/DUF370 family)
VQQTVALGFQNVIAAFHVVNNESIPIQFFLDERKQRGGIVITDEFLKLIIGNRFNSQTLAANLEIAA